jgi:hypothetical protein
VGCVCGGMRAFLCVCGGVGGVCGWGSACVCVGGGVGCKDASSGGPPP